MKKHLLKSLLALALVLITGNVWGENQTLKFDVSKNPGSWPTTNSTTLTDYTYSLNDVDYTFGLKNVKCNPGYLMLTSTAVLGLPAIDGYKLTKVVAKNSSGCSTSTKVGVSSSSSSASYISGGAIQDWTKTSSTYTYNLSSTAENTVYYLYVTNKNAQIISLELTYELCSVQPLINANNVTINADATSGEIAYTITNPVDGQSVTASTAADWISDFQYGDGTVTFTTAANTGAEREGVITLSYEGANDKDVTVTQKKTTTFASLEALVAAGAPASDENEKVTVTLTDEVITKFYTSSSKRNGVYLQVGDKEIEIYCPNVPSDWIEGGTISGTLEDCIWKDYKGTWELCPENWNELSYSAPQTYAITIDENIANGTVSASAEEVAAGVEVTLTVTPAAHYELGAITVTNATTSEEVEVTDNTFIMPASAVTVSATFTKIPTYTITWSVNGSTDVIEASEFEEGSVIIFPADVDDINGQSFVGWIESSSYSNETIAPEFVTSATATAEKTYYAVFADVDELPVTWTKATTITEGTYVMVSEQTEGTYKYMPNTESSGSNPALGGGISIANDVLSNEVTDAMQWNFISTGTENQYYIRPNGNDAIGLGTTTSTGANIRISKNYVNTNWTITTSTSANWQIKSGSNMYLAVYTDDAWRNYSNATTNQNGKFYFFKKNGGTTYSNYCTTIASSVVLTGAPSKSGYYYATFIGDKNMAVDENTKITTCYVENGVAMLNELDGNVIPANSPVLVYSDNETITLTPTNEEANAEDVECIEDADFNMLFGYTTDTHVDAVANTSYYALNVVDGNAGFFVPRTTDDPDNPSAANGFTAKAGKAYLKVVGAAPTIGFRFGDATQIENVNAVEADKYFDLMGREVLNPAGGIYILNGKKVLVK